MHVRMIALLAVVALAGCSDSDLAERSVSVTQADVLPDQAGSASLTCETRATVSAEWGDFDTGSLTIRVKDGNGYLVESQEVRAGDTGPRSMDVVGTPGSWTLIVDRSLEFDASFTVSLAC